MENASKALIMAGGLLISLMVASLLVFIFNVYGDHAREMTERINARHIEEANQEYLRYEDSENTIYDVVTAANNARDNNESKGLSQGERGYISVSINNSISGVSGSHLERTNVDLTDILNKYTQYELSSSNSNQGERTLFSCVVKNTDDLISEVIFTRIS